MPYTSRPLSCERTRFRSPCRPIGASPVYSTKELSAIAKKLFVLQLLCVIAAAQVDSAMMASRKMSSTMLILYFWKEASYLAIDSFELS